MSTALVVGFAGLSKTGKTRLSTQIAQQLGAGLASFGDVVRNYAKATGLDPSRQEVLLSIGSQLVNDRCEWFCRTVLSKAGWPSSELVLLDGVRHLVVVETVKRLIAPAQFRLVVVSAPFDVRLRRYTSSEGDKSLPLDEVDTNPISLDTTALGGIADYRAVADRIDSEFTGRVVSTIRNWRTTAASAV